MRKFVRTPPMSTATDASRGKPCCRTPTSEVVPPMSTTAQSSRPREERRAAHRVGRARGERRDRISLGEVDAHQRAVVLAQVHRRLDPELRERGAERGDDVLGKVAQAGVHDRRVLALEQADPADLVRETDRQRPGSSSPRIAAASSSSAAFTGENTDEIGDRPDALRPRMSAATAQQFVPVERRDRAAVELVAAVAEIDVRRDRLAQPSRPVDERRQRAGRRQAETHAPPWERAAWPRRRRS